MVNRDIIVIGGSAGGFEAMQRRMADLPADLDASVFIVWHMFADIRGIMPHVLNTNSKIHAAHATDNEPIMHRRIYVAPPDHRLIIEKDHARISRGPKENRFRPAIEPLFRSAACAFGARVIGVVLSGALDDGTAGLWTIKQCGGLVIVFGEPTPYTYPDCHGVLTALKDDDRTLTSQNWRPCILKRPGRQKRVHLMCDGQFLTMSSSALAVYRRKQINNRSTPAAGMTVS